MTHKIIGKLGRKPKELNKKIDFFSSHDYSGKKTVIELWEIKKLYGMKPCKYALSKELVEAIAIYNVTF